MTLSGLILKISMKILIAVLIPLLVDDPLWEKELVRIYLKLMGLNPSFSG